MFKKPLIVALFIAVLFALSACSKGNAAKGKVVYAENCAMCHGDAGKGDGPAGAALNPRPTNFSDKALMSKKTDDDLFKIVTNGVYMTGMAPYKKILSEEDRWDAVAYIRTFAK